MSGSFEGKIISTNSSIRDKNFRAFFERYGEYPLIDPGENEIYLLEKAKNNEAVLFVRDKTTGSGVRMNSLYSPSHEAGVWASKYEVLNRNASVVILGFSTGVFLRALMKHMRPNTNFFLYEAEEGLFSYICKVLDISDIIADQRVNLYITDKQRSRMQQALLFDVATYRPETIGVITPGYADNKEFSGMCDAMRIYATSLRNYQRNRGRNALRCKMYSWNHMWKSSTIVDFMKLIPEDIPAVIVSAGPSLRKNVDVLQRIKNHALIICTDRSLSVLDERGIEPDLIASVDAEKSSAYLDFEVARNKNLLCTYQLNTETQKMYNGRCIFYCGYDWEKALLGDKCDNGNGFDHGGNVAGSTFSICRIMGIKTIILIGQDLAYLDGKHHADDIEEGVPDTEIREVQGIDGNPVKTCDMWVNFRNFFERQIAMYPDLNVIDATEGGALIRGSKIMSLSEAADNICVKEYDLDKIFEKLPAAQSIEEYQESVKIMHDWMEDLDRIKDISGRLVEIFGQLIKICRYQDMNDSKYDKKLRKMNELRTEIVRMVINSALESYWVEDIYSIPGKALVIGNKEEAISVFEEAIKYYEKLPEDCQSLKNELDEAIKAGLRDCREYFGDTSF
ncbi:motility associated factor glycosyltransferase family protein [Butyrivibrio sp. VCD2006]|uniref:motility associated factor glycosyltransferase family protein n=1 Tax=Butyrivibrio sp. VCD2006 TaxID=1280664 RepID=UPI0004787E3D|nr:6-hydroxymethylpterin diphosphokinase MptE-like protein [Butyrivibrio sp. VCD2006]